MLLRACPPVRQRKGSFRKGSFMEMCWAADCLAYVLRRVGMKNEGGQGGAEGHGQFPVVSPTSARMGANVPHIRRTENRSLR